MTPFLKELRPKIPAGRIERGLSFPLSIPRTAHPGNYIKFFRAPRFIPNPCRAESGTTFAEAVTNNDKLAILAEQAGYR